TKCWLYFPEDNCPFYRATVFSNYSPDNVPPPERRLRTVRVAGDARLPNDSDAEPGPYWSLMLEISESAAVAQMDAARIVDATVQGCLATSLLRAGDEIVSIHHRRVEHGYPTPGLERDAALATLLPLLRGKGCSSV